MIIKIVAFIFLVSLFFCAPIARAADIGFEFTIKGGTAEKPKPAPPPIIVVKEAPVFLVPGILGFQVAVGIPYDMFLISGRYYAYHGDAWYASPSYKGPWTVIKYKKLPPGLRKHKIEKIRAARDEEYKSYKAKKEHGEGSGQGKGKSKHKGKN